GRGGEALRGDLAVLDVEHGADQHDLAGEVAAEEIRVVLVEAGVQVGKREGRDVVAAGEVERDGAGDGATPGELRRERRAARPGGELGRHRRHARAVDHE